MAKIMIKIMDEKPKLRNVFQMDESLFSHHKFDPTNPSTLTESQIWVFGAIEEILGDLKIYIMQKPNVS